MNTASSQYDSGKRLYNRQNSAIHLGRSQLGWSVGDLRNLAEQIGGKASVSSLSPEGRYELIRILIEKGAHIDNPGLTEDRREEVYFSHLMYWDKRFPRPRPGFASNSQLAWIETLWELDWDDGRTDIKKGLRSFIFRQTRNLEDGPIGDIAFLKESHVQSVLIPLKQKALKARRWKEGEK